MVWADGFWIKVGIVVFVMVAQGILWSWVFIRRRQVAPDVKVFNFREIYDWMRAEIDKFYERRLGRRY